jgi:translation initiation factor 2B subunit (eIF-2B alpha/beta/delta family)
MDERHVVTAFLRNRGEVLLLRRSEAVGSYPGRWGAVAGHAEGDPDRAVRQEIDQETGLADAASQVRAGEAFAVEDATLGVRWVVHPSLFDCRRRDVVTNEETSEWEWTTPTAILRRKTVPDLWTSYDRVRPTVETVADDTTHGSASLSVRALAVLRDEAALAAVAETEVDADAEGWTTVAGVAHELLAARPSMAVVTNRVNRAMSEASDDRTARAIERAAIAGIERALTVDGEAATVAAERIAGRRVGTLSRSGTVLDAVETAEPAPETVVVSESRPGREGVVVAERLADDHRVTLTSDAAFAGVLADCDALLVGADAVLPDGRVVNKVGTRAATTVANREGIDCYAVAATDKVRTDGTVETEPREESEVYDGDADFGVVNPTFEATPAGLFDAVLTERGPIDADGVTAVADAHRERADW